VLTAASAAEVRRRATPAGGFTDARRCLVDDGIRLEKPDFAVTDTRMGEEPRWNAAVDVALYAKSSLTVALYAGVPSWDSSTDAVVLDENKLVGEGTIPLRLVANESFDGWIEIARRKKVKGKVLVQVETNISGSSAFLAALGATKDEEGEDEEENAMQLVRQAPNLINSIKFAAFRIIYAIEPILMAKKQVSELLAWKSKPASFITLMLLLYVTYFGMVLSALVFTASYYFFSKFGSGLRSPSQQVFRKSVDFTKREDFYEAVAAIKDATRTGRKTSTLTDVRELIAKLERLADALERIRSFENSTRKLAQAGAVCLLLSVVLAYTNAMPGLLYVARMAVAGGIFYSFTLGSLYKNFPLLKEKYGPSALVRPLLQLLRGRASAAASKLDKMKRASRYRTEVVTALARRLAHPVFGVEVKDRKRNLARTPSSFVGSEAVTWVEKSLGCPSRSTALDIAVAVYECGAVYDKPGVGFVDGDHYYRFDTHAIHAAVARGEEEGKTLAVSGTSALLVNRTVRDVLLHRNEERAKQPPARGRGGKRRGGSSRPLGSRARAFTTISRDSALQLPTDEAGGMARVAIVPVVRGETSIADALRSLAKANATSTPVIDSFDENRVVGMFNITNAATFVHAQSLRIAKEERRAQAAGTSPGRSAGSSATRNTSRLLSLMETTAASTITSAAEDALIRCVKEDSTLLELVEVLARGVRRVAVVRPLGPARSTSAADLTSSGTLSRRASTSTGIDADKRKSSAASRAIDLPISSPLVASSAQSLRGSDMWSDDDDGSSRDVFATYDNSYADGAGCEIIDLVSFTNVASYLASIWEKELSADEGKTPLRSFGAVEQRATVVSSATPVLSAISLSSVSSEAVAVVDPLTDRMVGSLSPDNLRGMGPEDIVRLANETLVDFLAESSAGATTVTEADARDSPVSLSRKTVSVRSGDSTTFRAVDGQISRASGDMRLLEALMSLGNASDEHLWVLDSDDVPTSCVSVGHFMRAILLLDHHSALSDIAEGFGLVAPKTTDYRSLMSFGGATEHLDPALVSGASGTTRAGLAALRGTMNQVKAKGGKGGKGNSGDGRVLRDHTFRLVHFPKPTWCSVCQYFIWGVIGKQGYECSECLIPCHTYCVERVAKSCAVGVASRAAARATSIDAAIRHESRVLVLAHHYLPDLPSTIGRCSSLQKLDASHNALHSLPDTIGSLVGLVELRLDANSINVLPSTLGRLQELRVLSMDSNKLSKVPPVIGRLDSLTDLNLANNQINEVPAIVFELAALTKLSLSGNRLTSLPKQIGKLKELRLLNVAGNRIRVLPDTVGDLRSLARLDVSDNRVSTIPDTLGSVASLRLLYASHNQLTDVPASLGALASTLFLSVYDNALDDPLATVYRVRGSFGLLAYLQAKLRNAPMSEREKLMRVPTRTDEGSRYSGKLFLKVISASNLPAKDKSGLSDPYVIMSLGKQKPAKSKPVMETLNPEFPDAEHSFDVSWLGDEVDIALYDYDRFSGHDPMGHVTVTVRDLPDGIEIEEAHRLVPIKRESVSGKVTVRMYYLSDAHANARTTSQVATTGFSHLSEGRLRDLEQSGGALTGTLYLSVLSGRSLPAKDKNGLSDPYAVVRLGKQKFKTKRVDKTLNPTFSDEDFTLRVASMSDEVVVELWDWDLVGSDDPMGKVVIPLSTLPIGEAVESRYELVPQKKEEVSGDLELRTRLVLDETAANLGGASIVAATAERMATLTEQSADYMKSGVDGALKAVRGAAARGSFVAHQASGKRGKDESDDSSDAEEGGVSGRRHGHQHDDDDDDRSSRARSGHSTPSRSHKKDRSGKKKKGRSKAAKRQALLGQAESLVTSDDQSEVDTSRDDRDDDDASSESHKGKRNFKLFGKKKKK
jgi:Leucine-rich repeat (LRR) protein/CBS domain-containing protein